MMRRCARLLLSALALLGVCATLLAPAAWASRTVRVFEVHVADAQSPAALQEAMRSALVRATGRRDAASDPAFSTLVAEAPRFVQLYRPAAGGGTEVVFDAAAVEHEIRAAGGSVWERDRPFTLVVLQPVPSGAAFDAARRSLEQLGELRGLPVGLAPLSVVDANGAALAPADILQAARRLGGDAVLIGRGDSAAHHGQWEWTLLNGFQTESWAGPFESGVHGAADALARAQGENGALPAMETLVQVEGVADLKDYAAVGRLLEAAPGVNEVRLEEAEGARVTFRVLVRGGAEALERVLAGSGQLDPAGAANARLIYQYRP